MEHQHEFVDLNELETIARREYLPITLPKQLKFTNIVQIREYIQTHGGQSGYAGVMATMMEVFFGHYSTCRLPHKDLIVLWGRLFKNWVNELYKQNLSLPRIEDDTVEDSIRVGKERIEEEFKHNKVERLARLKAFAAHYRNRGELIALVSKFCFSNATRFYVIPLHLDADIVKQYTTLRLDMISVWYDDLSGVDTVALRLVDPIKWFGTLDPKSAAFQMFKPDLNVHTDELKRRRAAYNRWWKKERIFSLQAAVDSRDGDYLDHKTLQWDEARAYANQLFNALLPRSKALDKEDDDFIDNTEYEEDVNMYNAVDTAREDEDVKKMAGALKHTSLIDEEAAEKSGDYDAYVARALKRADRRTRKKEKEFKALEDEVDEKDELSEEDESEVDGGDSMDIEDTSGHAYVKAVNKRF